MGPDLRGLRDQQPRSHGYVRIAVVDPGAAASGSNHSVVSPGLFLLSGGGHPQASPLGEECIYGAFNERPHDHRHSSP